MSDASLRAAVDAHRERMRIHIGCGGQVTAPTDLGHVGSAPWFCHACDKAVGSPDVMRRADAARILIDFAMRTIDAIR